VSEIRPILEDDLHAYIDGALDDARRGEVEHYLAAHPAEAERVRGFGAQRAMLRAHFAPVLAEPIPSGLNLARMIEGRGRAGLSGWRAAAAACLLLALGGSAGWFAREVSAPEATGVAALAQEAAANYAVYGPDRIRPVEVRAEDGPALAAWMAGRLGRAVVPPDLARSGYRLMGGRVVATPHGPAGLFMYDDDHGSRLVLLTRRMEREADAPMSEHRRGDVATWSWAQNGLGYALASQRAPAPLHSLADEIRRQVGRDT
jgi:anti-sigma factor RsiW